MKKLLPVLLFLSFSAFLRAQFGFSGSYTWFVANEWENFVNEQIGDYQDVYFFQNGVQVGVDYWMRLKNVRVEFLPEVRYGQQKASPESDYDIGTLKWQSVSFHWNTQVYPLNFFGDCDCPTFSKQDPWLEKGLFLQLSPGVHYLVQSYESSQSLGIYADEKDWAYSLGLGAGIDFGLSDWITITPYGRVTRVWDGSWANFNHLPFLPKSASAADSMTKPYALWIPEAGLHLAIRWKH